MIEALDIQVRGIVQGVGFRPFVYRLARKYLINGWVLNATDGVFIHAEGEAKHLDEFILEISENHPAAAQVTEIEMKEVPLENFDSFEIRFSDDGAVEKTTLISPDLATCEDCARELFNPNDRRYRYPFINCTNCGPRFTIIDALPYDRKNTSMKDFPMCPKCQAEYDDPLDRRFHAQPDACFECGPHISWRLAGYVELAEAPGAGKTTAREGISDAGLSVGEGEKTREVSTPNTDKATSNTGGSTADTGKSTVDASGSSSDPETFIQWGTTREESDAIFAQAVEALQAGKILAVKGLGGFHLVCDAKNETALATLRDRKRRKGQAFAVMMPDVAQAKAYCEIGEVEESLLTGSQRPIVLLRKRPDAQFAKGLADGLTELGVMLPYTPIQHLLAHDFGGPLVMTSANIHDEPIVIDDEEAYQKLAEVADAFLGHNRAIEARYDDSVVRVLHTHVEGDVIQFIRRARGYAPMPLELPEGLNEAAPNATTTPNAASNEAAPEDAYPSVFATGPEQKNTFCLTRDKEAFVSQHIGDMENAETFDAWLSAKKRYETLFEVKPQIIATDMHPEYLSSKWAHEQENLQSRARNKITDSSTAQGSSEEYLQATDSQVARANSDAETSALPVIEVQHHHAHIASVMAENKIDTAVAGIAFDGTGYGMDGNIWGGEVLLCNYQTFERFANFAYVPMPGAAAAIKHPLRMAYGVLWAFDLLEHPAVQPVIAQLGETAAMCEQMIEKSLNTPLTSSVGRLFDAASAILGICTEPRYEGEGAILLEAAIEAESQSKSANDAEPTSETTNSEEGKPADIVGIVSPSEPEGLQSSAEETEPTSETFPSQISQLLEDSYPIAIIKNTATAESTAQDTSVLLLDAAPAFKALLDDLSDGIPVGTIARKFHNAFIVAILDIARVIQAMYEIETFALSGGVFMNRYLTERVIDVLTTEGFTVAVNRELPPNDGCISYGEAVVALASNNK